MYLQKVKSRKFFNMDPRIRIRIHTKMLWIRNTALELQKIGVAAKIAFFLRTITFATGTIEL